MNQNPFTVSYSATEDAGLEGTEQGLFTADFSFTFLQLERENNIINLFLKCYNAYVGNKSGEKKRIWI